MAKLLSSAPCKWSKYVPLLHKRYFSRELRDNWIEAPLCQGRKIPKGVDECHPKEGSCSAIMGVCRKTSWPECSEPNMKLPSHLSCCSDNRLSENPCTRPAKKLPQQEEEKPFISIWETCEVENLCSDAVERLDETHYKSTDKTKRVYTQTWENCDPVVRKRKVCCINEMCMLPPINKRVKAKCPQTAKEQDAEQFKKDYEFLKNNLTEITTQVPKATNKSKCRKITMPCCRKVAKSTKCHRNRRTSQCLKQCCPHPSFSECDHAALQQGAPNECRCSHFINQCDANQFLTRKQFFKLPPALPAWPIKERPK